MSKTLIATATYNEVDTIFQLLSDIRTHAPSADILVIDDSSTDRTGEAIRQFASQDHKTTFVERPGKLGVGSAHLYAMLYAINNEYEYLVTLDADFSHGPHYLPRICSELERNDFVIGSRYIQGGACEYPRSRRILSFTANFLVKLLLKIPLCETTTSYRGFSISLLKKILNQGRLPEGYAFFFEVVRRVCQTTTKLVEVPIVFEDRRAGKTKISIWEIVRAFVHLGLRWVSSIFPAGEVKYPPFDRKANSCPCCQSVEAEVRYPPVSIEISEKNGVKSRYACTTDVHKSRGGIADCMFCGNSFLFPQPLKKEIEELYADVVDDTYVINLEAREKTFAHNWEQISRFAAKNGTLLDVGSYCGAFLNIVSRNGWAAEGLEPSRWAANFCREHYELPVTTGSAACLPFEQRLFDVVTSWDVLEHVANPNEFLARVNRSLSDNGTFFFSTLNIDNWFPKLLGSRWPWYIDMHLIYFREMTIRALLKDNGFEVVDLRPYCHIITVSYLLGKLEALNVPGHRMLFSLRELAIFKKLKVSFRFGDIMLVTCRKVRELPN